MILVLFITCFCLTIALLSCFYEWMYWQKRAFLFQDLYQKFAFSHPDDWSENDLKIAAFEGENGFATGLLYLLKIHRKPLSSFLDLFVDLQKHEDWLLNIVENKLVSKETAEKARLFWFKVLKENVKMPVPSACTGPDGKLFYSWDDKLNHLEAEFSPNNIELFWTSRETSFSFFCEYSIEDQLPKEFVEKLNIFPYNNK